MTTPAERISMLENTFSDLQQKIEAAESVRDADNTSTAGFHKACNRIEALETVQGDVQDRIDVLRLKHNMPY